MAKDHLSFRGNTSIQNPPVSSDDLMKLYLMYAASREKRNDASIQAPVI